MVNLIPGTVVSLSSQYRQWNGHRDISECYRQCDFDPQSLSDYGGVPKGIQIATYLSTAIERKMPDSTQIKGLKA